MAAIRLHTKSKREPIRFPFTHMSAAHMVPFFQKGISRMATTASGTSARSEGAGIAQRFRAERLLSTAAVLQARPRRAHFPGSQIRPIRPEERKTPPDANAIGTVPQKSRLERFHLR